MKIKIENTKTFEPAPEGTHTARVIHAIELGVHDDPFKGKVTRRQKIGISFEIVGELVKSDGLPFVLTEEFNYSTFDKSKFYSLLTACFGKLEMGQTFDLEDLVDKPVIVTVEHKPWGDTVFARVINVTGVPAGVEIPEAKSPALTFSLDKFDDDVFQQLPKRLRSKISERIIPGQETAEVMEDVPY